MLPPARESIAKHFGPDSPHYERDIAAFAALYAEYADIANTIKVKRELWEKLLTAALGEIAFTRDTMDGLFVRHTYLTAVVGMVVQAFRHRHLRHGRERTGADLLLRPRFRSKTGLQGVVESDFFAWPTEVAAGRCSGRWPAASPGSSGKNRPQTTSHPSCTRR